MSAKAVDFDQLTARFLVDQIACLQAQEAYPFKGGDVLS
jgi:hypothetical protein